MEEITPRVIFKVFGIAVKSTVVTSWIAMFLIVICIILIDKFKPVLLEMIADFLTHLISDIMNIANAEPYLPLLGTLAIFVAVANSIGVFPVLSSPTSDINTPLALAIIVFFAIHYFGVRSKGVKNYIKSFTSPIFLLPLEIVGQFSRTLSLTLRLFGNVLSGDLIASIILSLIPLFVPLPLMALSLLIGILQAYVFTALSCVYIASAIEITAENNQAF